MIASLRIGNLQSDSSHSLEPLLADVILPRHLDHPFTYKVPGDLQAQIQTGSFVRVPFGRAVLVGLVVSLTRQNHAQTLSGGTPLDTGRLREIEAPIEQGPNGGLPADLLALYRWLCDYYIAPLGQGLRLFLPPLPLPTQSRRYLLTESGKRALDGKHTGRLSPSGFWLLDRLAHAPKGLSLATIKRAKLEDLSQTLSLFKRKGWIEERLSRKTSSRGRLHSSRMVEPPSLTSDLDIEQVDPAFPWETVERHGFELHQAIQDARHRSFLLLGSPIQRTAVGLRAVQSTLAQRRTALIITPEIVAAKKLAESVKRLTRHHVALIYSGLSTAERDEAWRRIRSGAVSVVVGTRSAVFSPLGSIGLIWVEDEENSSLKEEAEPRYHARDVACIRARQHGAVLLLGSAHPSVQTFHSFHEPHADQAKPVEADPRIIRLDRGAAPSIELVDLRLMPAGTLLSEALAARIEDSIENRTGSILFMNRKGFAPALQCRACGNSLQCSRCSVPLTFYRKEARLCCHYCGMEVPIPDACPSCLAARLEPLGIGVEWVEETIRRLFSKAKVGRVDGETPTPRSRAIFKLFQSGELDILVGTQVMFQAQPMRYVGCVGLVYADAGLHLPDFQAGERTFHMLSKAVAMARPDGGDGCVVLQTYLPTHHVIEAVSTGTPALFYERELAFRRMLGYPPFTRLISLRVTGKDEARVKHAAEEWALRLRSLTGERAFRSSNEGSRIDESSAVGSLQCDGDVQVLGPIPSSVARIRGRYRWQLLVKSESGEAARLLVRKTLEQMKGGRSGLKYEIDVDPLAIL